MTDEPKTPQEPEAAGSACSAVVGRDLPFLGLLSPQKTEAIIRGERVEITAVIGAVCMFIRAASDRITFDRKTAAQVKAYNESIRQMEESAARLRQTQREVR